MNDLHGILFAYHSDANLGELTRPRNTCSLAFAGRYRLVDFMLSSYVNAGVTNVGLIVHESYQSLLDHLGSGKDWELSRKHGGLRILPPFGYAEKGTGGYRGNMEALAGVQNYLKNIRQDYVIMGWGDLAINLDVSAVLEQHIQTGADVTVVCTNELRGTPKNSSYVTLGEDGRVTDLAINPAAGGGGAMESLEIYILSKKLLLDVVDYCAAHNIHSFARGVLLPRLANMKVIPYVHEGYAARFQSVTDYFQRSMELHDAAVRADLFNPARPIRTKDYSNPSTYYGPDAVSKASLVSDGCRIEGSVENSVLSRGVIVEEGAKVVNCVLMQGTLVKAGSTLSHVITDKNVVINEDRVLVGHSTYPLAIAKGTIV